MILNTKELIVIGAATPKPKPLTLDQKVIPAPPRASLRHLLRDSESIVIYPWQDHGPADENGEYNPLNYHTGVEILAFNGPIQDFEDSWNGARNDWIASVFSTIKANAEEGHDPYEVFEFGFTPCELDFISHGEPDRLDWGIRSIRRDWQATLTMKLQEGNITLADWSLENFPVGEPPYYDEDDEEI